MAKKYKIKVEVEFECPATVPPEEAFYRYFRPDNKIDNDNVKLLDCELFKVPAKVNTRARAHNEARRVLQIILDQSGYPFKINQGNRYKYGGEMSQFLVELKPQIPNVEHLDHHWIKIEGNHFFGAAKKGINLADPASVPLAVEEMKCTFWLCKHQDRVNHA